MGTISTTTTSRRYSDGINKYLKKANFLVDNSKIMRNFAAQLETNRLKPKKMSWSEYEERYGESRADFIEERETSWEQDEADAAGVPLYGPI